MRTWKQKWSSWNADMAENATNSVKLGELLAEKEAAERALEKKMERWGIWKNWRQRLRGRNEEYNVSFYKAVFFSFLFAAAR